MMPDNDYPKRLDPKDPAELNIPIVWIFNDPALTVSAASATASVYEGQDSNPSAILGAASFNANTATLLVSNGIHGVIYKIKMMITLTGGSRFVYTVLLPVLSA